jgi:hypothetical protein
MGDEGKEKATEGMPAPGVRAEVGKDDVRPSRIADGYNILARDFDLAVAAARLSGLQGLLLFYARRESWTMAIVDTPKGEKITESPAVPFMLNLPVIAKRHGIKDVKFLYTVHHQLEAMKVFVPADEAPGYFEIEKDYREWVDAKTRKPLFDATETGIILAEKNIGRHKSGGEKPTGVGKTPLAKWGKTRHRVGKTHTPSGENSYSEASDTIGTRAEERDGEKRDTHSVCPSLIGQDIDGNVIAASDSSVKNDPAEVERLARLADDMFPGLWFSTGIRQIAPLYEAAWIRVALEDVAGWSRRPENFGAVHSRLKKYTREGGPPKALAAKCKAPAPARPENLVRAPADYQSGNPVNALPSAPAEVDPSNVFTQIARRTETASPRKPQ